MRERDLEAILVREVRKLGGLAVKLMPTVAGTPDRIVLMPGGHSYLVELKTLEGRVDPIQDLWHSRSAAIGHHVTVLRGAEQIRSWCAALPR